MTRTEFVHQGLRYGSDDEFLEGTLEFVHDGLAAGDAVLAVVRRHNIALLEEALGRRSGDIEFVDADDWYLRPSRTLGQYHAYCADHGQESRVRVIGEPVWTGRTEFEAREWMRYESLLNVAFVHSGHWILCPYDTRTVPADVVRSATRTHPELALGARMSAPSGHYADPADLYAERDAARSRAPLSDGPDDIRFARGRSAAARRALAAYARRSGMPEQRTYDMVAAVHEALVNAVRFGGGGGVLRLRSDPDYVICEIVDHGAHNSAVPVRFPGQLPPDARSVSGHGLWVLRQLSDLVAEEIGPTGSTVRMYFRRPGEFTRPPAG
ncbi:anti-sigma regulatory factor [Streptomyces albiflavescens]|uniref:Anti-sigma regulatory factor n=1 Tax=Streptomyces albiflavescens TaxID=1623582 RepID=A0A917XQE0_9ACTN|nr:sensor histidine kinase [Streptomyces albiflavescens]GGN48876.1 anti-sigma regulatory factor [Streptomyces albiflavescens]